jgi:hypothetical protein
MIELPDGRLFGAGNCEDATGTYRTCSARLTPSGTLDPTYDGDGVRPEPALWAGTEAVALTADGRHLLVNPEWSGTELVQYDTGGVMDQYANGVRDWDSGVGDAHGFFGACLSSVTAATPTWTPLAGCTMTDGPAWRAIATADDTVAVANPLSAASTVNLHFGVRISSSYAVGSYLAPIRVSVVAP